MTRLRENSRYGEVLNHLSCINTATHCPWCDIQQMARSTYCRSNFRCPSHNLLDGELFKIGSSGNKKIKVMQLIQWITICRRWYLLSSSWCLTNKEHHDRFWNINRQHPSKTKEHTSNFLLFGEDKHNWSLLLAVISYEWKPSHSI